MNGLSPSLRVYCERFSLSFWIMAGLLRLEKHSSAMRRLGGALLYNVTNFQVIDLNGLFP